MRAASALARLSDSRGLAPQYARLLLELSRARLEAEPASPVGALPHALRCLAVCESFSLDAIHASAMTHLAEVGLKRKRTKCGLVLGEPLQVSNQEGEGGGYAHAYEVHTNFDGWMMTVYSRIALSISFLLYH